MERGRIQLVGVDEEEQALVEALLSAGYQVSWGPKVFTEQETQVLLVFGPKRIEGCRAARGAYPEAQVLACLTHEEDPHVGEYLAAGADDVLIVPTPRALLLARIRACLSHVAQRDQLLDAARQQELLEEVSLNLASANVSDGLYDMMLKLAEYFGFDRVGLIVSVPGEPSGSLFVVASSDDPSLTRIALDPANYPELTTVLDNREPLLIADAASDPTLGQLGPLVAERSGRTHVLVPVLVERQAIGIVRLRSMEVRPPPSRKMMYLLGVVARLLAVGLRDGRRGLVRDYTEVTLQSKSDYARTRPLERYQDFCESSADGMVVIDRDNNVLYLNRVAEQLTGFSRKGMVGHSLSEMVPAWEHAALLDCVAKAADGGTVGNFDLQLLTTSGDPIRASVSVSRVLNEDNILLLGFRDVTVARALEQELRKTKEFLERLIDSTVDAIVAADVRGRIIIFNRGAERLFGYSADEVLGKLPTWKLYPEGEAHRIMTELRSSEHGGMGRLLPTRREIVTRDGQRVPILLSASIIYEGDLPVATVGILSDLRERLLIEQRLAQAQEKLLVTEKQALIADLAGTTAHELNQPLTSVMAYAELLKKKLPLDDPNNRAADIILREAERMAAIVRKIGTITRYETKPYIGSTTMLDLDKSATEG